jgi:hypothetical protein
MSAIMYQSIFSHSLRASISLAVICSRLIFCNLFFLPRNTDEPFHLDTIKKYTTRSHLWYLGFFFSMPCWRYRQFNLRLLKVDSFGLAWMYFGIAWTLKRSFVIYALGATSEFKILVVYIRNPASSPVPRFTVKERTSHCQQSLSKGVVFVKISLANLVYSSA